MIPTTTTTTGSSLFGGTGTSTPAKPFQGFGLGGGISQPQTTTQQSGGLFGSKQAQSAANASPFSFSQQPSATTQAGFGTQRYFPFPFFKLDLNNYSNSIRIVPKYGLTWHSIMSLWDKWENTIFHLVDCSYFDGHFYFYWNMWFVFRVSMNSWMRAPSTRNHKQRSLINKIIVHICANYKYFLFFDWI